MAVSKTELQAGEVYKTESRLQVYEWDKRGKDPEHTWISSGILLKFMQATPEMIYDFGQPFSFATVNTEWGTATYDLSEVQLDFLTHVPRS